MTDPKKMRRRYLIDASLQLGLGARVLLWTGLYVVGFLALTMIPVLWEGVFGVDELEVLEAFLARLEGFTEFNFLALALVLTVATMHVIQFTHRLAGPMFRIKRTLRDIASGIYRPEVRLRDHDFFHDVAADLTLALRSLRAQTERCREANDATQDAARRLMTAASDMDVDPERLVMLAHEVLASAENVGRQLPHLPEVDSGAPAAPPESSSEPTTAEIEAPDAVVAGAVTP